MLVSPTEPERLRRDRTVSLKTEKWGVDFLWSAHGSWFGVQRKAITDLLASAQDGRLAKELAQTRARTEAGALTAILVVEGRVSWTNTGEMMSGSGYGRPWTRAAWLGLLWSVRLAGMWVEFSTSVEDTDQVLTMLETWTAKDKHHTLERRPGPVVAWGDPSNRDWQIHLLQGAGIGPETAKAILDACGMPLTLREDVTRERLLEIPGIGPKTADKFIGAFK